MDDLLLRRRIMMAQSEIDYSILPLTFKILTSGTLNLSKSGSPTTSKIQYRKNDASTWSEGTFGSTTITCNAGDIIEFRYYGTSDYGYHNYANANGYSYFSVSNGLTFNLYGNIYSLNKRDFINYGSDKYGMGTYNYSRMFQNCTGLISAKNLIVPYNPNWQSGNLTYCFYYTFSGCTNLVEGPKELSLLYTNNYCYSRMFNNCTSLRTAPEILSTELGSNSVMGHMFHGCSSLVKGPSILHPTSLKNNCYQGMFYGCSSLTTAPILPATTLVSNCYTEMFYDCSSLNYIKAMFTTTPSTNYTQNWIANVADSGIFVKNSAATWSNTTGIGYYGIPLGWTVQTASS